MYLYIVACYVTRASRSTIAIVIDSSSGYHSATEHQFLLATGVAAAVVVAVVAVAVASFDTAAVVGVRIGTAVASWLEQPS